MAAQPERTVHCSFCGKSQHDVRALIAGPGVFICNECISLCVEIVDAAGKDGCDDWFRVEPVSAPA